MQMVRRVLVREVPDADHRTGLATCAHAYRTTEDLLAATVGPRAPEVWKWLEARPFVGRSGDGLHLHDLVRDVFDAEFAQRNPDAYVAITDAFEVATRQLEDTMQRKRP